MEDSVRPMQDLPEDTGPLDPQHPDHRIIHDELDAMAKWAGVDFIVRHNAAGDVRAEPGNLILLDFAEIRHVFAWSNGARFRSAVVLALGHELGHLIQYAVLGYNQAIARPQIIREAQADLLAGAWLGLRLGQSAMTTVRVVSELWQRLVTPPSHARLYPDAAMRDNLVIKGMSLGAMLNNASTRTGTDLAGTVSRRDFDDLWRIAERVQAGSPI